jgi:sialic acid synthase SpsE
MDYDSNIFIGCREVALDKPTYFIADIAANHDGDLGRAKELIYLAREAGADCAKFQHFLAKDIVSDFGFKALGDQKSHQSTWNKSIFDVYEQYQCPRSWTDELINTCKKVGIDFMTTPYDFEAIDSFADIVPAYKVGSGDITWTDALERIALKNLPVFLATGASTMNDVERAVSTILAHNRQLVLMQCNTNYTANLKNFHNINLKVLQTYSIRWPGMLLGLSDHTIGHATVLGAIALGARVIEKHFTDDNKREGPDHHFAMNAETWREMIDRSRELEHAMGSGVKVVESNELDTIVIQRRAIRVRENTLSGTVLTSDHIEVLRPCPKSALGPHHIGDVIGRKLKRDVKSGEHLEWIDLE